MRKYRNRVLAGFAIGFIIYLALLLVADARGLTHDLMAKLQLFPWLLVVPIILQKIVSWFFRFLEWHYYLGVIGARDKIGLLDSVLLWVSGFTMVVSPGKAAEVLKAVVLKTKTGIPVAVSAPVVLAERVVDGVAVIVLSFLALLLAGNGIDLGSYRALIYLSTGLLIFGLVAVQLRPVAYFFLGIIARLPLIGRARDWLTRFYESSYEIFKLKHLLPATIFGVVAGIGDTIGFLIILSGFGVEVTWLLSLQAVVIFGLASAIGALSGVPNGAGITEISVSAMLTIIVAPTNPVMTPGVAAAAAVLQGFFYKWFRVLVGLAVATIFRRRLFSSDLEAAIAEMEQEHLQQRTEFSTEVSNV